MKRFLSIILTVIMIATSVMCVSVFAADEITVTINGKEKAFDVTPVIINDRTLVPMRGIFEAFGATIEWDGATQSVTATVAGSKIVLQVGKVVAMVNGQYVDLDAPARLIEGHTMVPARFVAESLGCEVGWDADTKTVLIKFEGTVNETKTEEPKKEESSSTGITYPRVLLSSVNMKDMVYVAKAGTVTSKEGLIEANVTSEATTETEETNVYAYFKETLNGRAATGDVCLLTFKARLLSGGKGGKGIAKVQVQGDKTNNYKKALYQEVTFGSDWTDISLPFTHKEGCNTVGIRFALAVQKVEVKDVSLVNYGTTKTIEQLNSGDTTPSAPAPSTPAPSTPSTPAAPVVDAKLPAGGTVIATQKDFATCVDNKSITEKDGVVVVNATKQENDNKISARSKVSLSGLFKEGNVYMLTFKARVTSGSPYLKAYIQSDATTGYKKPVYAATSYGKDWTTCYMPFVGHKVDMNGDWGFRLAGETHTTEIKDLQIIDYGTSVKIADLPHTYIVVGDTYVNGLKID